MNKYEELKSQLEFVFEAYRTEIDELKRDALNVEEIGELENIKGQVHAYEDVIVDMKGLLAI